MKIRGDEPNVGTPSLEARNIRLVNIITNIIEESKLILENMLPNARIKTYKCHN
jgi:hypothetical protein